MLKAFYIAMISRIFSFSKCYQKLNSSDMSPNGSEPVSHCVESLLYSGPQIFNQMFNVYNDPHYNQFHRVSLYLCNKDAIVYIYTAMLCHLVCKKQGMQSI